MEPGLTYSNIVKQRILGPPMQWRFNRGTLTIPISTAGGTDYSVAVADLGWIEKQWLVAGSGTIHQLEGAEELAKTSNSYRPKTVAPVYDDNAGNITFRTDAVPDANYTIFVDYQKKAPLIASYGDAWDPIPDEYGYIYNQMFLAIGAYLVGDARAPMWSTMGVAALLGAQQGLSDQAIAIFVGEWDRLMSTITKNQNAVKTGSAALAR